MVMAARCALIVEAELAPLGGRDRRHLSPSSLFVVFE
jgi:hypothetical protein